MKILKESKEDLPVSFLTAFVSKGWDAVGELKDSIEAIRREFKGTKKVEELLQALVDAYLVCIGQVELHMQNNDYLEFPEEAKANKLKESVEEGQNVLVDVQLKDVDGVDADGLKDDVEQLLADVEELNDDADSHVIVRDVEELEDPLAEDEEEGETAGANGDTNETEEFEYFVDFDEPVGKKPTDEDIFG